MGGDRRERGVDFGYIYSRVLVENLHSVSINSAGFGYCWEGHLGFYFLPHDLIEFSFIA